MGELKFREFVERHVGYDVGGEVRRSERLELIVTEDGTSYMASAHRAYVLRSDARGKIKRYFNGTVVTPREN